MENFSVTAFLLLKGWRRGEKKMSSLPPYLSVPIRTFYFQGKHLSQKEIVF
jgi:hypothetical protein